MRSAAARESRGDDPLRTDLRHTRPDGANRHAVSVPTISSPTSAAPRLQITEAGTALLQPAGLRCISSRSPHGRQGAGRRRARRREPLSRSSVAVHRRRPRAVRTPRGEELIQNWREWVVAMGSRVIDLDAARHDELVAWVSHLPQFVATALSALLEERSRRRAGAKRCGRPRPPRDDASRRQPLFYVARHRSYQYRCHRSRAAGSRAEPGAHPGKSAHPRIAR